MAQVCLGKVGAVAAREVSRFARNSRVWQQLIEMCRVVDTVLIDQETIYAPRHGNDRLLLGLKGSLNEYELDLLRQRSLSARYEKARRGELIVSAPVDFVKAGDRYEKDPDRRVQEAIGLAFVHEGIKRSGEVVFRCSLSGTDVDRWLEIPAWMFERSACARVRVAADAHADLAALMALAELVRDALSDRFAPSNARLSGASNLSRDQNRGEVNATPDEADAGDAACRNKSTCSQENPGRRPAARQRGLGCRQRHKPR